MWVTFKACVRCVSMFGADFSNGTVSSHVNRTQATTGQAQVFFSFCSKDICMHAGLYARTYTHTHTHIAQRTLSDPKCRSGHMAQTVLLLANPALAAGRRASAISTGRRNAAGHIYTGTHAHARTRTHTHAHTHTHTRDVDYVYCSLWRKRRKHTNTHMHIHTYRGPAPAVYAGGGNPYGVVAPPAMGVGSGNLLITGNTVNPWAQGKRSSSKKLCHCFLVGARRTESTTRTW
jgi:hypothetical protein